MDEVNEPNYKKPHPSRPSHKMLGRSTFSIGEGFGERSLVWVADGSSFCDLNDLGRPVVAPTDEIEIVAFVYRPNKDLYLALHN